MNNASLLKEFPSTSAPRPSCDNFLERLLNRPLPMMTFRKGECIHTQGKNADCVYAIRAGLVLLSRLSTDGQETVLAMLGPGEHFGETNLLLNECVHFNAVSLIKTELLVVRKSIFLELLQQPEACQFIMRSMARRCSDSWAQIEVMACNQVSDKIRFALSWLCTRIGVATPGGIRIDISQRRLAQMVGASRESLNRKIRILKEAGILETTNLHGNRSCLLIRSPELLPKIL
jgi:CRP/FNR family transcriptional regulator, cyclic AMP receptor protein